ncbi:FliI/YscN family ATPase [Dyella mobilis]|uniref:protein-secreting ATPase n=1 Tax=Dyella mobilis TaxID=1849582 RepID=A0ABS2KCE6_9GAMM|nr:FliI/YscN family ATPase [Dyella mobilis]MBM7128485.1 FliI/YscN family ATPase [Dyella mobilis]GLQ99614.1 EscN/YscN/HrcN family type III secretion system ATPase [Dyella mobilis]
MNAAASSPPNAVEVRRGGKIVGVTGTVVRVIGVRARVGDLCRFVSPEAPEALLGEVVGLDGEALIVMPIGSNEGLSATTLVESVGHGLRIPSGRALLGRVVDGFCRPMDALPPLPEAVHDVRAKVPSPLHRPIVDQPFATGVRAIDGLLTIGVGQRVGVFAGPGVGKTSLMSAIAAQANVDAVVIGLIGERGREVQEFMRDGIAPQMRERAVVVVATSDRPAAERIKSAHVACAIAESLRDEGAHVLLVLDSLTRFARALREIGLAAGEPPARRGFPPSVFAELPRLIERAGRSNHGAITGFYTVLAEGQEMGDPVSEEAISLLDGHIALSRDLAAAGHFPAIDVLASRSRVMDNVCERQQLVYAGKVRQWMAAYQKSELLIRLGEYRPGADAELDEAVAKHPDIRAFLQQPLREAAASVETAAALAQLATPPAGI